MYTHILLHIASEFHEEKVFITTDEYGNMLGRFDVELMPAQDRMELAIENTNEKFKQRFQCKEGYFRDIFEWSGVLVNEINEDIEVYWDEKFYFPGDIRLSYLPTSTIKFSAAGNNFSGSGLTYLPRNLEFLSIARNRFHGNVDLTQLPAALKHLDISDNEYEGTVCLIHLPNSLENLHLGYNFFTGSVDLSNLACLMILSLEKNEFSGSIDISNLTSKLHTLDLSDNLISGEMFLENLPESAQELNFKNNNLCGKIHLLHSSKLLQTVDLSGNDFEGVAVVDVHQDTEVNLRWNKITSVLNASGDEYPRTHGQSTLINTKIQIS